MTESIDRRKFLASAAGAAAIPAFFNASKLVANPLVADPGYQFSFDPAARKVRTGFIGIGGRGTSVLREVLKSGQAEMVAFCDVDPSALDRAVSLSEGMSPKTYEDYHEMLKQDDLEAVFIATPVDLHVEMAVAACEAKKHIYCEKPLGKSAKDAEKIYEAAEKNPGKVFQVGFQWVYNPNFRAGVEAIHQGLIGKVGYVHSMRHGGDLPYGKAWLFQAERSGDIIVEQAVHEMNIVCWALQSHPEKATGFGGTNMYVGKPEGRTIMDHYSVSYEFPGPIRMSYSHLYYSNGPISGMHIWVFGEKGAVDIGAGQIYMADGQEAPAPRDMKLTGEDTYNAVVNFFNDVRSGKPADASAEKGLLATKMSVLGREAVYKGKTVKWKSID